MTKPTVEQMRRELSAKERQKNLDRFLKDSAVKDRLYHGTSFAMTGREQGINDFQGKPIAAWVGRDPKIAEQYSNKFPDDDDVGSVGQQIYPVHVSTKKPFKWKGKVTNQLLASDAAKDLAKAMGVKTEVIESMIPKADQLAWQLVESKPFVDLLKSKGYDSIHQNERGYETFGVFHPHQIKSATGNRGTYDPNDPDITKADGGVVNLAKGGLVNIGINVATDRKAGRRYADLIVDGHKSLESRNSDSLRPYVGKRVAIVRTGEGPAKAIGEVTIGEPMVVNKKKFRALEDQHLVPEGSSFDINTPTKHLYPMHDPVRYDDERDVGHGIIARKLKMADGGTVQGGTMPTLAEMRAMLMKRGNPIELQSIGVNEAPGLSPKAYMPPDRAESFQPAPGGVATQSGMPIGGIDQSRMMPGQQLMPQQPGQAPGTSEQPGRSATGQPQGNQPGQQPSPPPTGFGPMGSMEAQPSAPPSGAGSNILSMTPQGRALNAIGPAQKPQNMATGGGVKQQGVTMGSPKSTRMVFQAEGSGGVKGINVPRHMWEGSSGVFQKGTRAGQEFKTPGMKDVNAMRAKVYGGENRDPLTIGQIGRIHKDTLAEHFKKPIEDQVKDEKDALGRLREAGHIGKTANTLDESEKLDTVRHEHDEEGRTHVGYASKGVAGHALYTSGHGKNMKHHVINTCPGQTEGCGGGKDAKGIVDTTKGTCFAPVAEAQYPGAAIRRASHEQAKHDPAMTRDWILAHTGSIRDAANAADKKNQRMLFRPNVVDETDTSSRHVIRHLNEQRKQEDKPGIIANSYGKTNELHDPENGYYVTHSNVGPKVKQGREISENIGRDRQRVSNTIMAANAKGVDFSNEQGNKTPPKGSYMVTNVKRGSPLSKKMQEHITHAKYWSTGRDENELSDEEKKEGPEGHYGPSGRKTTPEKAHYGHTTLNGRRYDYQKQHILHPRLVQVGENKDGTPHMIPTDSRFKDTEFLPKDRFKTKNGKEAGHILMTTPTESTSNLGHETSFTHHVDDKSIKHAMSNNGEYEIDKPEDQEKARGKEYAAPQPISIVKKAGGGSIESRHPGLSDDDFHAFPERNFAAQRHLAMRRGDDEARAERPRHAVVVHKNTNTMRHEMMTRRKG